MYTNLPQEIQKVAQWTVSYSVRERKRPTNSTYSPNGGLTMPQAIKQLESTKLLGLYVTPEDPFILGDFDHIDSPNDAAHVASVLPAAYADFLLNRSLYVEVSPSGKGLRFIARLRDVKDKETFIGNYRKNRHPLGHDMEGQKREAQINMGRPWMTITGKETPYSSGRISILDPEELYELFNYPAPGSPQVVGTERLYTPPPDQKSLPSLPQVLECLRKLPWDGNPRIRRAFQITFEEEYSNYEYWLRVLMAVSDYSSRLVNSNDSHACLDEVIKWSARDPVSFESEEDVIAKWNSLLRQESRVTYHSLLSLNWYNQVRWPQPKALTKEQKKSGVIKKSPLPSQYANFKAMVDFFNLTLYRDAHTPYKMYLTGDRDVLDKHFYHLDTEYYYEKYLGPWTEKTLLPKMNSLCQEAGYVNLTSAQIRQNVSIWMGDINKKIDIVRLFFDTPFHKLPVSYQENADNMEISTVDYLFDCLTVECVTADPVKERELYKKYYRSWLLGLARNIFFREDTYMNNCILLLIGREQIRKTSHFLCILPKFMRRDRVALTTHGFATESSLRDVAKLASMNNLIIWDEIDRYLKAETESNFKQLLDNNPQKIIDKYEVVDSYILPIAIYGGTSNEREFQLSDNGNRRLFIIPISWCDTDAMEKVNWWKLVNDLRDEIAASKEPPWLLSEDDLDFQTSVHNLMKAKSSIDLVLEDMFDFEQPFPFDSRHRLPEDFNFRTDSRLWTVTDVAKRLKVSGVVDKYSRKHLLNVLRRLCGRWTGTHRTRKYFDKERYHLYRGELFLGQRSKFWLPPLATHGSSSRSAYFTEIPEDL